jgi:shikimate dehydrogenase
MLFSFCIFISEFLPLFVVSEQFTIPINAATRLCAVYGWPIKHSASPAMHNAAFAALGLNWRYLAFEVHPDDLRAGINGARAMRFAGVNLTVPHKLLALELMDAVDESAREYGAVNTVRFESKDSSGNWQPLAQLPETSREVRMHGFNTDADAITRALREDLNLEISGARILILGAGGAGRVAALKLARDGGAELFLVNRTRSKAESVAQEIKQRFPQAKFHVGYPKAEVDLALNATSAGLNASDPLPFDPKEFSFAQARTAYDMIYRPAETPFLQAARKAGCRTANGIGMLLYQGAKAFELWTGKNPPISIMREALMKNIYGSAI